MKIISWRNSKIARNYLKLWCSCKFVVELVACVIVPIKYGENFLLLRRKLSKTSPKSSSKCRLSNIRTKGGFILSQTEVRKSRSSILDFCSTVNVAIVSVPGILLLRNTTYSASFWARKDFPVPLGPDKTIRLWSSRSVEYLKARVNN